MSTRTFRDMFRPVYEMPAASAWIGASLGFVVTHPPLWGAYAAATFVAGSLRLKQACDLYRFRASITTGRLEFLPVGDILRLAKKDVVTPDSSFAEKAIWNFKDRLTTSLNEMGILGVAKYPDSLFLGRGFRWSQRHAEVAREIMQRDVKDIPGPPTWLPPRIKKAFYPRGAVDLDASTVGVPWIHGIEPDEGNVRIPIDSLPGHTLIVGTTRAGKTRLYEVITSQVIHRGSVLIVIDPKGDKDLEQRMRREAALAKRPFLYFNPAFPSKSIRINPLANWNSMSEPASRLGQLIDADGSFAAFAWKTLFRIMRGSAMSGERPTIRSAKQMVQSGVETMLEHLLSVFFFETEGGNWAANLHQFELPKDSIKGGQLTDRQRNLVAKYKKSGKHDEVIDSLIAMIEHSKEHYSKMIQVLEPILEMLGADELGKMLSPDPLDLNDKRPIYDTKKIIDENAVLYIGLDSLSNRTISTAIGQILLADFASVAGAIYNFDGKKDIFILVDEAAEVMNEQAIQILNKGGGAGIKAFIATQTTADLDAIFGSRAKTMQSLGNLNNVICLRIKDMDTAEMIAKSFGKTAARQISVSKGTGSGSGSSFTEFNGSTSMSQSMVEIPFVSPDLLTRLQNGQFFAFLAGSALYKGRLPLIKD